MLLVRSATMDDFNQIAAIYRFAQDFMIKSGNPYPMGTHLSECGIDKIGYKSKCVQSHFR